MRQTTLALLAAPALLLALSGQARASSIYPDQLRSELSLSYAPACSVCHQGGVTGSGTVTTPFGQSLRDRGLVAQNPASLTSALDKLLKDGTDSDQDGVSDVEELVAGTNPNGTSGGASAAAPELGYGCAATIAPASTGSGGAGAVGGLAALLLVALASRRRRALLGAAVVITGALASGCYDVSYVSPEVCSSGLEWTGGEAGSPIMNPGLACIECHSQGGGPRFTFAGTAFDRRDEADTCLGAPEAVIIVTGADGRSIRMTANESGNFYTTLDVALPYQAKLVVGDREEAMTASQTNGDCNSCHTEKGASGAPGRISLP